MIFAAAHKYSIPMIRLHTDTASQTASKTAPQTVLVDDMDKLTAAMANVACENRS